ncbi:T9SS type A sorting domain-containing protein [Winogradskyella costae]|uniref:T9SS type A sorting domain-containing protein n=1 Tax=Winogradskyella costae TaxID=2697008 RepID=UPI0015CA9AFF|nr:T9SS type A sorting domain-containing protein [Winogradskyella costae]
MKFFTCITLLLLPLFALSQITLNQTDDFEDYTTKNWTKGDNSTIPNQNILTDGPNGTDDKFLRVQSNGGNGSDSKLVTFNNAQWQGDYNAAGVTYISMDVRNSGSETLFLRLAFEGFSTSRRFSSTNPIAVIPGQGWQTIVFPIDENSVTNITTSGLGYNSTFDDVTEFRMLHNDAPSWEGDPIEAILDIDNITARNDDMGLADTGEPKIALNLIDDFEGVTTENWTKGNNSTVPNQNILTDGPNGSDDNFLRVQSNGGNGSDSKLVTFNNAQWQGDYNTAGVTYISMDVRNSGSETLFLRLAFEGFSTSRRFSSTNPIAVTPGQGWQTIVFPIDENSVTNITTSGLGYNSTFDDVREFRMLHNDAPSWEGDPIEAILDIDNITARNDDMGLADTGEPKIALSLIDDFEGATTENWTKGNNSTVPNHNILTDGPNGSDDNFLRVQSNGGNGSDSKLVTFNNAQWQGDYNAAGVTYISMDVRNSGSSIIILRLAFEGFSTSRRFSSTNPIAVIPGQGWQTIVFPIDENSVTNITTSGLGYNSTFDDVREFRILHNDTPSWEGDSLDAVLDIDNIQARNETLSLVQIEAPTQNINVYPNPSADFIQVNGNLEAFEYSIYDITGKLVLRGESNNQTPLNVSNLMKGTYFITIGAYDTIKFFKD